MLSMSISSSSAAEGYVQKSIVLCHNCHKSVPLAGT